MKRIAVLTEKSIFELEKSLKKIAHAKFKETGLPFVTLKYAQTLDGKIATLTGDSRWISGPPSLQFAHRMRNISDAVLVGVDTIIRDNPRLTVRLIKGRNPKKIILDARLRMPLDSNVLRGRAALSTIIATTSLADQRKIKKIESTGAEVWLIKKDRSGNVNLKRLLQQLGQRNFCSILVEGGSKIISSFLRDRLVDHLVVVIAPQILGRGINSVSSSTVSGFKNLVLTPSSRYFLSGCDVIFQALLKK